MMKMKSRPNPSCAPVWKYHAHEGCVCVVCWRASFVMSDPGAGSALEFGCPRAPAAARARASRVRLRVDGNIRREQSVC